MDILESLKTRRSVRKFTAERVPEELLARVVEAGLYAPYTKVSCERIIDNQ